MAETNLIEIRCPFERRDRNTQQVAQCNKLIIRVSPESAGEAYCSVCKKSFFFEFNNQNRPSTSINVQPVK